jgi:Protein of unknown function (DUF3592)
MGFPTVVFGFIILVAAAIGVFGLVSIVRGVLALGRSRRLAESGQAAMGTIVDNQMQSHQQARVAGQAAYGSYSYMTFRPVVAFRTQMGQEIVAAAPTSSRTSYIKGTTVQIRYNPDDPTQMEITSGRGKGSGGMVAIVTGIVAVVFVVAFLVFAFSIFR